MGRYMTLISFEARPFVSGGSGVAFKSLLCFQESIPSTLSLQCRLPGFASFNSTFRQPAAHRRAIMMERAGEGER